MKFFIPGLLIGAIINIFVLSSTTGFAFYPEYTSSLKVIQTTAVSPFINEGEKAAFTLKSLGNLYFIKSNGKVDSFLPMPELSGISGNGEYYILYEKVGTSVELYSGQQRFWKQKSMEYPYLSYSGRLIFMLNGDQTAVRIIDHNGNELGIKTIAGRICTAIVFPERTDFGAAGFLDGTFQLVNHEGQLLLSGTVSNGGMVKSMAVSDNGNFLVVHGGNVKQDHIELHNIADNKSYSYVLSNIHLTKTALSVSNDGKFAVLDKNSVLFFNRKAKLDFAIKIDEKRDGQAAIKETENAYFVAYTTRQGLSKFMAITKDGTVICTKDFPGESFLGLSVNENIILLRGSDNLYCYSLHELAE